MAQLIVRNLDESLVRDLKRRAGEHGVSMEEEHRCILRNALQGTDSYPTSFKEYLLSIPDVGADSDFERDRALPGRATEQNLFEGDS